MGGVAAIIAAAMAVRWFVGPAPRVFDLCGRSSYVRFMRQDRFLPKSPIVRNWKAFEKQQAKKAKKGENG